LSSLVLICGGDLLAWLSSLPCGGLLP